MASILRSAKFVRYIAGFARNVVVTPPRELDPSLVQNSPCLCEAYTRNFATEISTQRTQDQSLERSLRRLDQDVRRSGRISRRDIEDILEEIRNTRTATSSQSLLVIRCCGNLVPEEMPEVRTKLVQEIWNTLNKLNVPMDISHYNALLRVYLENEHPFSPAEFLSDLEAKGIEPNRVTYQRLIARYCQLGDIEGATRILEFMREKQLPVNENVFNALIMGHSQSNDMESAKGILGVMQQAGLEPSADTYTTLLCGYAKSGDIDSIRSTLEECEAKEVFLIDKDYLDIAFALATNNHSEHVPFILSKVRKSVGYNQDAINLILRLINNGRDDTALEVLKTMPVTQKGEEPFPVGNFLIKHMVKAKRPYEKIISVCKHLQSTQLNPKALLVAIEASLHYPDAEISYALLRELKQMGGELRQHYFWPIIVSKGKEGDIDGMLGVIREMSEFDLIASSETLREYVIPHMKGNSAEEIINRLVGAGVSIGSAAVNTVFNLLQEGDIATAAQITSRIPAFYLPSLLKRPLTHSLVKTGDVNSYSVIMRNIYEGLDRLEKTRDAEDDNKTDKTEYVGQIVLELFSFHSRNDISLLKDVLNGLVEQGLSISSSSAEKLQDRLGERLTVEVSTLLGKLTSGELTPVPLAKTQPVYTPANKMNQDQLERLVANLEAKGEQVKGLKRQLLTLYCRNKELEKTETLLAELDDEFEYSSGLYAQLIELYCHHDDLEKALHYYDKLKELEPDGALDDIKAIRLSGALIKNNRFDEAIAFLEKQPRSRKVDEHNFSYTAACWRLLNSLAEEGKDVELKTLFDTLVKKEFIEVTNALLGPLIKVHLVKNDLNKAMEEFELFCTTYRATPWKNELACRFIQAEDANNLQKLTDLSTDIHGEVNSLYDLVLSFVECGRVRQARKILETPGLQSRPHRLNMACERYQQEGMVEQLVGLVQVTRDLNHIDRSDIYYQLLLSYIKKDDVDNAFGLWTQMQEEDVQPTDQFLAKLGNFLKLHNRPVPFAIPNVKEEVETPSSVAPKLHPSAPLTTLQIYRQALRNNDVDVALEHKNRLENVLTITDYSNLIESLVRADRVNEATKLVFDLLSKKLYPIPRVFRFYLNKVANGGDVDTLERVSENLDAEMKKVLSFDNRLCHANIVAGKTDLFLDSLERQIDEAKDEDLPVLGEKFPRGGAVGILEKVPELEPKYELIATKYAKRGLVGPMNVLWAHHFINDNDEAAERIWSQYLKDSPRLMFQRILQEARDNKNDNLARKLIEHLKVSNVTEGAVGNAYSCLIDVLAAQGKLEETVSALDRAVKDVGVTFINRTAVLRVKEIYEKLGKPFPYTVPPKNAKATSSSSSSDEAKAR